MGRNRDPNPIPVNNPISPPFKCGFPPKKNGGIGGFRDTPRRHRCVIQVGLILASPRSHHWHPPPPGGEGITAPPSSPLTWHLPGPVGGVRSWDQIPRGAFVAEFTGLIRTSEEYEAEVANGPPDCPRSHYSFDLEVCCDWARYSRGAPRKNNGLT